MQKRDWIFHPDGVQIFLVEEACQKRAQDPEAKKLEWSLQMALIVRMGCQLDLELGKVGCNLSHQRF